MGVILFKSCSRVGHHLPKNDEEGKAVGLDDGDDNRVYVDC